MQRHHGALAETYQRQRGRRQVAARKLGVEEALEHGRCLVDTDPALVRIAEREVEPLLAGRRLPAGLRRVRRDERGLWQQPLPGAADLNQIVAIGAVAMQEHYELACCAACVRLKPWSVQFSRHGVSC